MGFPGKVPVASLGVWNDLKLLRCMPEGAFLDGGEHGEVFLPVSQVPRGSQPGQMVKVLVYLDAEDRLLACTRAPLAQRGDVAELKVVAVNKAGAFLAWGVPQDLFLPWKEVKHGLRRSIREGQKVLVILFMDEEGRMAASTRLEDFLSDEAEEFQEGDKVELLVGDPTDLGVRVVVNHHYWGMVHRSDIFGKLVRGEKREGYIKALRADHRLNVYLHAPGYAKVDPIAQAILEVLKRRGGFLPVTDKSKPEEVHALFGISKKAFKQALGALYKSQRIAMEPEGIRLVPRDEG